MPLVSESAKWARVDSTRRSASLITVRTARYCDSREPSRACLVFPELAFPFAVAPAAVDDKVEVEVADDEAVGPDSGLCKAMSCICELLELLMKLARNVRLRTRLNSFFTSAVDLTPHMSLEIVSQSRPYAQNSSRNHSRSIADHVIGLSTGFGPESYDTLRALFAGDAPAAAADEPSPISNCRFRGGRPTGCFSFTGGFNCCCSCFSCCFFFVFVDGDGDFSDCCGDVDCRPVISLGSFPYFSSYFAIARVTFVHSMSYFFASLRMFALSTEIIFCNAFCCLIIAFRAISVSVVRVAAVRKLSFSGGFHSVPDKSPVFLRLL
eukprot:comp17752_c0_seq1/m.30542 comp17752_c0_seq1/g.30542  ORF comp17752_c0_seq1/g.30542 comp17752_c0_seq1/m.30542 type:complete len:323 (-) comp17752_c0_seq1:446-1414(-)